MNEAACSCRTTMVLILVECLSASSRLAAFSPAPPKAASTPTLSRLLTIASYTRTGRALLPPQGTAATTTPSDLGPDRLLLRYSRARKIQPQIEKARNNNGIDRCSLMPLARQS